MNGVEYIDNELLDILVGQAADAPRLRKNYNFHKSNEALCNRLLNAIEPGSYIRPHRHNEDEKGEAFIVIKGRLALFFFDYQGKLIESRVLGPGERTAGVDIAPGTWHSAVALDKGTVFFEAKAGPYKPLEDHEIAPWAPAEGDAECVAYVENLLRLLQGD